MRSMVRGRIAATKWSPRTAIATTSISSRQRFARISKSSKTDTYKIAGGKQSFSVNTQAEAVTDPEKIEFKQSVTLNDDYLLDPAKPDPKLGEAVISAPFYISKDGPNPPGPSQLTPKPVTRFFFAKHYESGTMVDDFQF
ncbi:hypothetical protein F5Y16DRAFT_406602 [Xylariaceae sp. FL0255]|nr:hypothetical protein F5Y16DRAFT_406602 [Xylariaceae sp. FL0255]